MAIAFVSRVPQFSLTSRVEAAEMHVVLIFWLLGCAYAAPADRSDVGGKNKDNSAIGVGCGVTTSMISNSENGQSSNSYGDLHDTSTGSASQLQDNTLKLQNAKVSEALTKSPSDHQTLTYGTQVPSRPVPDPRRSRTRVVVGAPPPCQRRPGVLCRSDVYEFVLYGDDARTTR